MSVIELLIDNATDDTLRDGSLSVRSIPEAETKSVGELWCRQLPKLLIVIIIIIIVFRKIEWFRFHGQRDAHNSG